jgi:hypothetical protein
VDGEGFQIGLAYVDGQYTREGVQIEIVPDSSRPRVKEKSIADLGLGDRFPLPVEAVVLSRFPEEAEA